MNNTLFLERNNQLKKMDDALLKMTRKLVTWSIAYCPPVKNNTSLMKNNPDGYSYLMKYLALEEEFQVLLAAEKEKYKQEVLESKKENK